MPDDFGTAVQRALHRQFVQRGLTVGELVTLAKVDVKRPSMSKKIRGKSPMTLGEAEAVAKVLGVRVAVRGRRAA